MLYQSPNGPDWEAQCADPRHVNLSAHLLLITSILAERLTTFPLEAHAYLSSIFTPWQHVSQYTVQAFKPSSCRPDVCQCLVVQTAKDNISNKPSHTNHACSLRIKATFSREVIRASLNRLCIMPELPRHLVQEFNVGTVVSNR